MNTLQAQATYMTAMLVKKALNKMLGGI